MTAPDGLSDRRQALLAGGALALAAATGAALWREERALPEAVPIPSAPGFRRLEGGTAASGLGATAALVGIEAPGEAREVPRLGRQALCDALFRADGSGPPIAVFSDFYCTSCPEVPGALARLSPSPALTVHEWPVLGPRSDFAARVALAAGLQGAHLAAYAEMLQRRPRPSDAGALQVAERLGLDPERLVADLDAPAVTAGLQQARGLAAQLGLAGTPSLVIGDTVVTGLPAARILRALAEDARTPCTA